MLRLRRAVESDVCEALRMVESDTVGLFEATEASAAEGALVSLAEHLSRFTFKFGSEDELQAGIESALTRGGILFARERHLCAGDRPDFLVDGGLAIEVKVDGPLAQLLRQASRYAAHPEVRGILVVGTPGWMRNVPDTLCQKPVRALKITRGLV